MIFNVGNRCDEETVISSIKNYLITNNKNLNLLASYAEHLRVGKEMKKYMEVIF